MTPYPKNRTEAKKQGGGGGTEKQKKKRTKNMAGSLELRPPAAKERRRRSRPGRTLQKRRGGKVRGPEKSPNKTRAPAGGAIGGNTKTGLKNGKI